MILFRAEEFGLQENDFVSCGRIRFAKKMIFSARENSVCKNDFVSCGKIRFARKCFFFCAGKFGLQKK
jgi:hypothetical protein